MELRRDLLGGELHGIDDLGLGDALILQRHLHALGARNRIADDRQLPVVAGLGQRGRQPFAHEFRAGLHALRLPRGAAAQRLDVVRNLHADAHQLAQPPEGVR
ncbi:hypothetical protein SDC9_187581 [bioreactor metagenome]|uniref:Uncharacterized protein n=1 Tax=bioreactor metagenome TaxID=1076179 RepID=A0A645HNA0_9ZZZZ